MKLGATVLENVCFKIIVKPDSKENKILGYDKEKLAIRIAIKAKADKNKANIELIKFLSKQLNRKVRIKTGLKSREKIICIV
ncbi:YggU family protein [Candidatus Woesearchaeota archaeon]|nr:YggU family protein [Candidatus Woesearchaeota archaeon]